MSASRLAPALLLLTLGAPAGCTQERAWSLVLQNVRADFPEVRQISTDSLATRLGEEATPPLLLDVRTPEEFAVSHLAGAVRVDPDGQEFPDLADLPRDAPVVTYCSVGYRSSRTAERLRRMGFTNVSNLEGSLFRWANEGRPVYRDDERVEAVHPFDGLWGRLLDADLRATEPE